MRRPSACLALLAAASVIGGCAQIRSHQGYVVDSDLVNSVQPGVDNRDSVLKTLGRPSFAAQFGQADWYYYARDSRNYAFRNPHAVGQLTLRISFDPSGTVSTIRKGDLAQIASISPDGHTTPTLGRKRGFFQDLFGNIGTVGAGGSTGGGGDSTGRTGP